MDSVKTTPRMGWEDKFEEMTRRGDDRLLDADVMESGEWFDDEWEWS